MSLFNVFGIASSGLAAQSQRLNVVASNLANAESTSSANGEPYRAHQVVFETAQVANAGSSTPGVRVSSVIEDSSPMRREFNPKHPNADDQGYVTLPNVNVVDEMVNMISASRSYQSNVDMMNTAKNLLLKTMTLGS